MDKGQIAELLYKFVKYDSTESRYCYENYLNESIGVFHDTHHNYTQEEKDVILKEYIKDFIEENRPAPQHFYLKLKETGKTLEYETSPNCGDFCCDIQYLLTTDGEAVWEAESLEHATWVKYHSTEWYNADYTTPGHYYKPEELEVVDEYGFVYDNKPMSDMEYASLHYKVYGEDNYLKQIQRHIRVDNDYDPEKSYNNNWYSIKCLKDAEGRKSKGK